MLTLIAFILILSLLVFVHELGHFIVAKRSGITVEEFAIGFPPRAVKLWQDEGRITLADHDFIIPRTVNVPRSIQPGSQVYAETSLDEQGRRVVTRLELVTDPAAEVEDITKDGQPGSQRLFEKWAKRLQSQKARPRAVTDERHVVTVGAMVRPTEYSINWIPFGGYVRMVGEEDPSAPGSFASKSKTARLAVLAAGSFMNLVAAVFFFTFTAMSGVPEPVTGINAHGEEVPVAKTVIKGVMPDTPAAEAGLQAQDVILGADQVEFKFAGDLVDYVQSHKGTEIILHVQRGNQKLDIPLVPRVNPPEKQGAMGVEISHEVSENKIIYYPFQEAVVKGFTETAQYVALTFYMPIAILKNILPAEAARPTGPVGIYQQTGSAVQAAVALNWWFPILWLTAVLSTALAVTNLLPLPALDGGRILFIIIEAIRGKRIAPEKEGAIHFIGLAVLLTIMLVISYYDISSPIPTIDWNNFF